jgi:TRAP-type C4-dicarboxylate transport system permease small subunit
MLLVDKLCEKLSVPASKLLSALALKGYGEVSFTLGMAFLFFGWLYYTIKFAKFDDDATGDKWLAWAIAGVLPCIGFGVAFLHVLAKTIIWLADPEGYALLALLERMGGGK